MSTENICLLLALILVRLQIPFVFWATALYLILNKFDMPYIVSL